MSYGSASSGFKAESLVLLQHLTSGPDVVSIGDFYLDIPSDRHILITYALLELNRFP